MACDLLKLFVNICFYQRIFISAQLIINKDNHATKVNKATCDLNPNNKCTPTFKSSFPLPFQLMVGIKLLITSFISYGLQTLFQNQILIKIFGTFFSS